LACWIRILSLPIRAECDWYRVLPFSRRMGRIQAELVWERRGDYICSAVYALWWGAVLAHRRNWV